MFKYDVADYSVTNSFANDVYFQMDFRFIYRLMLLTTCKNFI